MHDRLLTEIERQEKYLAKLPEGYAFPLFNARQALESQRRSGYKNTASAARELVDNAYEAGASEVHIIFDTSRHTDGRQFVSAVAFIDNGSGMIPKMAQYALSWGGGTHFEDPSMIGKFGFGLPNSSINQTRYVDVFTRVAGDQPITRAWLNLDEFSKDYGLQSVHEPVSVDKTELPKFVQRYLEAQKLPFEHGTIVVWDKPDRLTFKKAGTLKEHLEDDFGVVYRYFLADPSRPLRLLINGDLVEPVDPLFLSSWGRYYLPEKEGGAQERYSGTIPVAYYEDPDSGDLLVKKVDTELLERINSGEIEPRAQGTLAVRIARFPVGFAAEKKSAGDAHRRLEIRKPRRGMSFVRADREIDTLSQFPTSGREEGRGLGNWPVLQSYALHWGVEVKFDPGLDELLGVTNDKQGVRPAEGLWRLLSEEGIDKRIKEENRWQEQRRKKQPVPPPQGGPSHAAQAAWEADVATSSRPRIPEHARHKAGISLDEYVKAKAQATGQAPEAVRAAVEAEASRVPYDVAFEKLGVYAPFYTPDWFGQNQVRINLNEDHPFYTVLYSSLLRATQENGDARRALEALHLVLFALGKAELIAEEELAIFYERQRVTQWSQFLATAMEILSQKLPVLEDSVYSSAEEDETPQQGAIQFHD